MEKIFCLGTNVHFIEQEHIYKDGLTMEDIRDQSIHGAEPTGTGRKSSSQPRKRFVEMPDHPLPRVPKKSERI